MPDVQIKIDVAGEAAGVPGDSRTFAYSKISGGGVLISLSLGTTTGITEYFWELVDQPPDAAAVLDDPTSATPTFTAVQAKPGTYLIRCTVNSGQSLGTNGLAFTTEHAALRPLAAGEALEFGATGWVDALNAAILASDSSGAAANAILKDGSVAFEANQPMGGYKITGLAPGTVSGDAVEYDQMVAAINTQTIDEAYDDFGANPAVVVLDGAEGQTNSGRLVFEVHDDADFIVDVSNASAPSGGNGQPEIRGFKVQNGSQVFKIGYGAANQLNMYGGVAAMNLTINYLDLDCNTSAVIDSTGSARFSSYNGTCTLKSYDNDVVIEGVGIAVNNRLAIPDLEDFVLNYDYYDRGNGNLMIRTGYSPVVPVVTCDTSGNTTIHKQLFISDGTDAAPAIAFTSDVDTGIFYRSTIDGTVGISIDNNPTFATYHFSVGNLNAAVAFAEDSPNIPAVGTNKAYVDGSDVTAGYLVFAGVDSAGAGENWVSLQAYVLDHIATSEDAELRIETMSAGVSVTQMIIGTGVKIGTGALQGYGTLVVSNGIYAGTGSQFTVSSSGVVVAPTFDTGVAAAGLTLNGTTLAADGTDTHIDISLTPKGNAGIVIASTSAPAVTTNKLYNNGGVLYFDGVNLEGSGDVTKVGTPVDNQVGIWTGDGTIEGSANLTFDGSTLTVAGTTATRAGVFTTSNASGHAVEGHATNAGSGTNMGVEGTADGYTGRGVQGVATYAGSGLTHGGYFSASSYTSRAVYGISLAAGNYENYGGYFVADGNFGRGVYGFASVTGSAGWNYGGYFEGAGDNGYGIYAKSPAVAYSGYFDIGKFKVDSQGAITLDADAASSFNVTSAGLTLQTTTSGDVTLSSAGNVVLNGTVITAGAVVRTVDGTVGAPAWSFTGDTDTGVYAAAANTLGFACGGDEICQLSSVGLRLNDDERLNLGDSSDTRIDWCTSQTQHTVVWAMGNTSRSVIFTDYGNQDLDHGLGNQDNPTIFLFSDTLVTSDATQYIAWAHNQTDATKKIGTGGEAVHHSGPVSLADDASFDLPDSSSGWGTFLIGDGEEFAIIRWTSTATVTLVSNSTNVDSADTDANFCFFDNGTAVRVRNRLGTAKEVFFSYHYTT